MISNLNIENIKQAYKNLKNYVYFDSYNHFARLDLAKFEYENLSKNLNENILEWTDLNFFEESVFQKILDYLTGKTGEEYLEKLIEQIDFRVLPKKFELKNSSDNQIISNKYINSEYDLEDINYFIKAPIELLIIDVLWIKYVGYLLEYDYCHFENKHKNYCYAYKINFDDEVKKKENKLIINDQDKNLFKPYFYQYQNWLNNAFETQEILYSKKKKNSVIISLDIKEYYYNIDLAWDKDSKIKNDLNDKRDAIKDKSDLIDIKIFNKLNYCLEKIQSKYREKIAPYKITGKKFIPIGLLSSGVLANWYLRDFDYKIIAETQPAYYGRYVDDILLVYENNLDCGDCDKCSSKNEINVSNIINRFLSSVLTENKREDKDKYYNIEGYANLFIKSDKIKVFYFDAASPPALIEKIKTAIKLTRSEFRYLPDEESIEKDFIENAYQVNYVGSVNKLRSVDKYLQDKYATSVALTKRLQIAKYCNFTSQEEIQNQSNSILHYFNGLIGLQLYDLWEKALTYFIYLDSKENISKFYLEMQSYIDKIKFQKSENKVLEDKVKNNLYDYLLLSLSLALSLKPQLSQTLSKSINDDDKLSFIEDNIFYFRISNLIKHKHVFMPYFTLTELYKENNRKKVIKEYINLIEKNISLHTNINKEKEKLNENEFLKDYHPLNFTFQEKDLFDIFKEINYFDLNQLDKEKETVFDFLKENDNKVIKSYFKDKIRFIELKSKKNLKNLKLKFALPNLPKKRENEIASDILGKHNLSYKKYLNLKNIFNLASKENANFIILPEISIPPHWLIPLTKEVKEKNIGIVCGIEHWTNFNNYTFNFLAVLLPFDYESNKTKKQDKSCFLKLRLKREYSPNEEKLIYDLKKKVPCSTSLKDNYDLFIWNDIYFSCFNCFEFANINDRAAFKGKTDFLVSIECNPDVDYFTNIAKATTRDLHSYILQANYANYGGSSIYAPKKSNDIHPIQIRGGLNSTIVTYEIDMKELKKFQYTYNKLTYNPENKYKFKALPPDFPSNKEANERIKPELWV